MARESKRKKAEQIKTLWDRANSASRIKWQTVAQKCYDFFLNDQLSKGEVDTLEESGMPTFVINRVTPVIEMMKFFVTAKNPRWQAVAAEGSDSDIAAVHADLADYCWHLSNGRSVYSQVAQDALVKGVGYFLIEVDPDMDRGLGEVVFKHIEPFNVYVDPMSRDFLFRDATYIMVKKDLSKSQLKELLPEFKNVINKVNGNSTISEYSQRDTSLSPTIQASDMGTHESWDTEGKEDEVVSYFECYSKIKVPFRNVFVKIPPSNKELEMIQAQVNEQMEQIAEEQQVLFLEQSQEIRDAVDRGEIIEERAQIELKKLTEQMEQQMQQVQQQMQSKLMEAKSRTENKIVTDDEFKVLMEDPVFKENLLDAIKFYETRIKVSVSLAGERLLYESVLPIQDYPIIPIAYTYTGTPFPMSAVAPLIGKQQELNKAHQIMLHNANLASNLRWMYEEGSVPEEEWEQYSSSPGALLKYRQGFSPPTPVNPAPINNAFFTIVQQGKQDMEYMSGIYSSMQGGQEQQHDTYRGMLAVDEYGTRRIKAWMQTIVEPSLEHLGKVFKDMAQAVYQAHKVFRVVQPGAEEGEPKRTEMNIPMYDDYGKAMEKWNDYSASQFDIRIVGGSTLPINRWALLEEYFRWFQSGLIDDIAMLGQTDIRGKESIMKRKSVYSQLKAQVGQLEEALKQKIGDNETLSRQIIQAGIKDKVNTADKTIQKDVSTTEAQQKMLRGFMQKEFDMAKKDLNREMTTAVANFKAGLKQSQQKKD